MKSNISLSVIYIIHEYVYYSWESPYVYVLAVSLSMAKLYQLIFHFILLAASVYTPSDENASLGMLYT